MIDFVMNAIYCCCWKSPLYEVIYNGTKQRVAISIGENGFIVGANPKSIG